MAVTSFSGQYGHNMQLEVLTGTVSQDIANNRSRVRVWAVLKTNGYAAVYGVTAPLTININGGGAIENVSVNINANQSVTIWQKEYDIGHNADGSKSFSVSVTLAINSGGYDSATVSQTVTLKTIARASSMSIGAVTIGSPVTINVNRAAANLTHTIRYAFGNRVGTVASNVGTSTTWTPPLDFATQIPNATSSQGTLWCDTYSGSNKIGTSATIFTISAPNTMKPSLASIVLTDSNAVAQNLIPSATTFLQIISNINVTFSGAAGAYGSTITGYKAEIVGRNQATTENGGNLGIMNYNGPVTVRASVMDSRGRWSEYVEQNITILEYYAPALSFTAIRGGANSSIVSIIRNAKIAPLTVSGVQKNTMRLSFKVAKVGTDNYVINNGAASGTWTSISSLVNSEANLAGTFSGDSSWLILGILEDKFTRAEFLFTLSTEAVVYAYDKQGRLGVGKIPERGRPGSVDVAGDYYHQGKLLIDIFYPVGAIFQSTASTNPSTFMGGTWERFGNGKVLVGVSESEVEFNSVNRTGGEKTHKLTIDEIPSHTHGYSGGGPNNYVRVEASKTYGYSGNSNKETGGKGGDQPHNNLQPYVTIYRWRRIA